MDAVKLDQARTLYVNRCSGCHNLELPEKHSLAQWETILSTMSVRAELKADQKEDIWRYISTVKSIPDEK